MRRIQPPIKGAADSPAFSDTPEGFAPASTLRNVRVFDRGDGRGVLARRPGLKKRWARLLEGEPQGALTVQKASVITGYRKGEEINLGGGRGGSTGDITGGLWIRRENGGIWQPYTIDVSGLDGPSTIGAVPVTWSSDGNYVYTGVTFADTVRGVDSCVVEKVTIRGETIWSTEITVDDGSGTELHTRLNTVHQSGDYVFATARNVIVVLNAETGAEIMRDDVDGWADEVIECGFSPDGSIMYAAFVGAAQGSTTDNGLVIAENRAAKHFRSGVAKYEIDTTGGTGITRVPFGQGRDSSDVYYEADHQTFRFSEQLAREPRGCYPEALAVDPTDGTIVVGMSNTGYGPNYAEPNHLPDGRPFYSSLCKISVGGELVWEVDTDSIKDPAIGPDENEWFHDIKDLHLAPPSVFAVRINDNGVIFTGGRRSAASAPNNVHAVSSSGLPLWDLNLDATILQACIAIDPTTQNPLFFGDRSDQWVSSSLNPSSNVQAFGWEVEATLGDVRRSFDLAHAVDAPGVSVRSDGWIVHSTAYIS